MQGSSGGRRARSVSELYAADEVELLLEELRDLERPARVDVQDFEIAGSQTGFGVGVGVGGGGRTPDGTVRSWDSHPNYGRAPPPPPARVAPVYCFAAHLGTSVGALRLAVAVCSLCCVWLEYAGGGSELWLLPHAGRLRLLLATALFSLMASAALLFLDVSRLVRLFPFNWAKLNAWLYACVGAFYATAASLTLAAVVGADYWWVDSATADMLIAASSFGLIAAAASGATSLVYCYRRPPPSSSSALLGAPSPSGSPGRSRSASPSPPPSGRAPVYLPVPVEPDPLPCSSKTPL